MADRTQPRKAAAFLLALVVFAGAVMSALQIREKARERRHLMLAYASYTVITPEGCSAILWSDRSQAARAFTVSMVSSG